MSIIERIRSKAAAKCPVVVLPESTDERILQAAVELNNLGIARPVLLGDNKELQALANKHQLDLSGIASHDIEALAHSESLQRYLRTKKWYADLSESALIETLQGRCLCGGRCLFNVQGAQCRP